MIHAKSGRATLREEVHPTPLLEKERLVNDPGKRWLKQAFGGQVALVTQFRIHGHV